MLRYVNCAVAEGLSNSDFLTKKMFNHKFFFLTFTTNGRIS